MLIASKKTLLQGPTRKTRKNPKTIWELINEVSTGRKSTQPNEKIVINGNLIDDKQQIAEHFNKYFSKIGKEISDSFHPPFRLSLWGTEYLISETLDL